MGKKRNESHVQFFATPWAVALQAPLPMGFSRPEYRSGLPLPSPGHLPNPGTKSGFPALQADSLSSEPTGKPFPSPGDLPDPGIKAGFPALQADSLPSEPPEKS